MENLNLIPGFYELFLKSHPEMVSPPISIPQEASVIKAGEGAGFPFFKVVLGGAAIVLIIWGVHKLIEANNERIQNSLEGI